MVRSSSFATLCVLCLLLPAAAVLAGPRAGDAAPALVLPLMNQEAGGSVSLEDLRGKVVYLDFWASWCGPCRLSFPQLQALREELGPRGFEVLAVNVDEFEADAVRFLDELPVTYLVARDASGETPARFGILGMPTGFLIDREGIVQLVHQGYRKSDGDKLRTEIIALLGEQQ